MNALKMHPSTFLGLQVSIIKEKNKQTNKKHTCIHKKNAKNKRLTISNIILHISILLITLQVFIQLHLNLNPSKKKKTKTKMSVRRESMPMVIITHTVLMIMIKKIDKYMKTVQHQGVGHITSHLSWETEYSGD